MAPLVPRLAPGSIFAERFEILEHVGQGSTGSVYRAAPTSGGPPVALRLVSLDAAGVGGSLSLEREAEIGRELRSPHVAAVLEWGTLSDRVAWLAMEFAPGVGLDELVRARAGLPSALARRVLSQVFLAAAAAHARGRVHGALKPENVRVAVEGEGADETVSVKVLDFGITRERGPSAPTAASQRLWAAPELASPDLPVPSADVWSLGLLSFFALTGRIYWRNAGEPGSLAELAVELRDGEISSPRERSAELQHERPLPDGFDAWFVRAVHREPSRRFRDASEAWTALEPLLSSELGSGAPEASNADGTAERPALVVKPGPFVTAVILSCVAAGLAIYWLLRSMRI